MTLLSGGGGGSDGESIEDPNRKYVSSDPDKEASGGEDATTVGQRHTDGSRGGDGGFGGGGEETKDVREKGSAASGFMSSRERERERNGRPRDSIDRTHTDGARIICCVG